MESATLEILYEDNHCLAVAKPGGIATAHFQGQDETLDRQVKAYLKDKYNKPGNVYLGIVHRLDKPVSGVVLFARTSKAAAQLSEQFREGSIEKTYWAVIDAMMDKRSGTLEDWLWKNKRTGRVEVVKPEHPKGKQAVLHYTTKADWKGWSWLELRPQTGRTHQLRVQLAARGFPIFGDAKYGSVRTFYKSIGLHAQSLTFLHPVRYEPITLKAEVPSIWKRRFAYLLHEKDK